MSEQKRDAPSVLILGGYGSVGSRIARMLRRLRPELRLTIAGRDRSRASTLAGELGHADAAEIRLDRADLGLPVAIPYRAVVVALRDHSLNTLRFAEARGIPYVALSDAVFELGPLVARHVRRPSAAAIVMLGHSIGAVPTLVARHFSRAFQRIDAIEIGLVLDPGDPFGPQSGLDMDRIAKTGPAPLLLQDGQWRWAAAGETSRHFTGVGGQAHEGQAFGLVDLLSLWASTNARSIRVDVADGLTASSRRGGEPSHEVIIEIAGKRHDGTIARDRIELVDSEGYATLSARGIALVVEQTIGAHADTAPAPPGLYLPENLVDPSALIDQFQAFGVTITHTSSRIRAVTVDH